MTAVATPPAHFIAAPAIGRRPRRVALVGNPNVGKSSLYNALTGLHQKVTNYPGTTVEKVVGRMPVPGGAVEVVDVPGSYSLLARSPDEAVARDEILGRVAGDPPPDVVVIVLDACHLERNLFFATQVLDAGLRCVVALNQADLAAERGVRVDADALARRLGVPVVPTCGRTGHGRDALVREILAGGRRAAPLAADVPAPIRAAADDLAPLFERRFGSGARRKVAAALASEAGSREFVADLAEAGTSEADDAARRFAETRGRLAEDGVDVATGAAHARYEAVAKIAAEVVSQGEARSRWPARLDRALLHPVFGSAALLAVFAFLFLVVFSFSQPLVDLVDGGLSSLGDALADAVGPGLLGDFLSQGVVKGFGAFLVFAPQIALLFLCIEALEDSGYLARAAFLLDRVMGRVGLPGRAFLPLLSGFACAIPGILATRTMSNARDRLATMAVLPLMSCSARLPVYAVIVGALFTGFGWWVPPLVVVSMYLVGIAVAVLASGLLRRTVLRGGRSPLLLELPAYRLPSARTVARNTARRTWAFVAGAGPIILAFSVGLWALMTFPRAELSEGATSEQAAAARREQSYMGCAGKLLEPAIAPLGFDWKIGVGILSSFGARETFVPTLGVVYAVGEDVEEGEQRAHLLDSIRDDKRADGSRVFTPLVGVSLLVFYVIALQCMSTLAVLRRETNSWRWPVALFAAYCAAAYCASLVVFQAGRALGL